MKIHVSALLLTIGVVMHFGMSSSMPSSPPNQPTSPPRNQRREPPYQPPFQDRPVFDKNTGELLTIFHKWRRFNIDKIVFAEKDPNDIPDLFRLWRVGPPGLHGNYHEHKIYYAHDFYYKGDTIEPQRNDLVVDPTGVSIVGMFGDGGRYYEIVRRIYP